MSVAANRTSYELIPWDEISLVVHIADIAKHPQPAIGRSMKAASPGKLAANFLDVINEAYTVSDLAVPHDRVFQRVSLFGHGEESIAQPIV